MNLESKELLLPCPFCGSKARLDGYISGGFFVECSDELGDCHQPITNRALDEDNAIRMWNRRYLHDNPIKEIKTNAVN